MYIMETNRLKLRQMNAQDIDNLMEIFSDPIAMQYYPSTYPIEVAEKWIKFNINNYEKHGCGMWICELKDDDSFVGQCGIIPQVVDEQQEMEIGWLFVRNYWGRGLATEAAQAVRDYGFKTLGLNRLIATIYHLNTPSVRVAERIGMKYEKRTFVGSSDDVIYALQKDPIDSEIL